MARTLILAGIVLIVIGLLRGPLTRLGLGRLPGDIVVERENFTLYIPVTSAIIVSVVLSVVVTLIRGFLGRGGRHPGAKRPAFTRPDPEPPTPRHRAVAPGRRSHAGHARPGCPGLNRPHRHPVPPHPQLAANRPPETPRPRERKRPGGSDALARSDIVQMR